MFNIYQNIELVFVFGIVFIVLVILGFRKHKSVGTGDITPSGYDSASPHAGNSHSDFGHTVDGGSDCGGDGGDGGH